MSYLSSELSNYSAEVDNENEIIAKVFSDYFTNEKPCPFSLKFIEEIDKIIYGRGDS